MAKIAEINSRNIYLSSGTVIPVGRAYKEAVKQQLNNFLRILKAVRVANKICCPISLYISKISSCTKYVKIKTCHVVFPK